MPPEQTHFAFRILPFLALALPLHFQAADRTAKAVPQSAWAADGVETGAGKLVEHRAGITSVVLHHTESPNEPPAMEKARLAGIRRYHIVDRGWGDIAYHYLIGPSGTLYEGRGEEFQGDSGTSYDLDGRLLVCVLGNFTGQLPEEPAMQSLVETVAAKLKEHKLTVGDVVTHRMVAATDCPGDRLQAWFDTSGREAIQRCLEGRPFTVSPPTTHLPKPPVKKAETAPSKNGEDLAPEGFAAIPPLAVAPVGANPKAVRLNQRFRSPDGSCEFGVTIVRVGSLGTSAYDRLITWRPVSPGESETTSESTTAAPGEGKVTERFGVTGKGGEYTRYFLRTYSLESGDAALAVLWEWMVRSPGSLSSWRETYDAFKKSVDLSKY